MYLIAVIDYHLVASFDFIALLACLTALVFLICGWKRPGFSPAIPTLLLILLLLMTFYMGSLFLEWAEFTERLQLLEDITGVFIPFTWAFLFYAIVKNTAEKRLRAGRKRFRDLLESTSDWVWEVDAQGQYTYVSPRVREILGYAPEEILGKTPLDLMSPAESERFSTTFAEILEKKEPFQHVENVNLHKDGHEVILETNGVPVFDKKKRFLGYRGINRDNTERKKAELQTVRQQSELNGIFAASPVGIGLVCDRKLTRGNKCFFEITGYSQAELIGRDPRDFYPTEEAYFAVGEKYTEALEKGSARIETHWIRKDRSMIDVVIYLSPLDREDPDKGFVVIMQDVTALKAADEQAMTERARAQLYLDVAGVIIIVLDPSGKVMLLNKKGCELLECSAEEAIGADWFQTFLPGSYRAIVRNAFQRMIGGYEGSVAYFENPVLSRSGVEKLIAWHNSVLRDESGRIVGIISSGEDVTETREAAAAVRENQERLRIALSAAQMGTWRWVARTDQDTRDANLNALLGLAAEETTQDVADFFNYVHPDDRAAAREEFDRAIRKRGTYLTRFRIIRPDGQIRWVLAQGKSFYDFNGQLDYVTGVVVDITEQQLAEQRLQESEAALRRAQRVGKMGNYELDLKSEIITASDEAKHLFGFTPDEEITLEKALARVVAEDRSLVERLIEQTAAEGKANAEYRIVGPDGQICWVHSYGEASSDPQGEPICIFGIVQDITERQKAVEALEESELRYRNFILLSGEGIARFEYEEPMPTRLPADEQVEWISQKGILAECNDCFAHMYGYKDAEEFIGAKIFDLWDRKDVAASVIGQLIKDGYQWSGDETHEITKDGVEKYFLNNMISIIKDGHLVRQWLTQIDITERKLAEQQLRESEAMLQKAQNMASLNCFEYNAETGIVTLSEKRKREMGGEPDEEVTMDTVLEYLVPEDRPILLQATERAMTEGQAIADYRIVARDRLVHWVHVEAEALLDKQGKPVGTYGITQDVTAFKETELRLRESEAALLRAQHIAKLGTFEFNLKTGTVKGSKHHRRLFGFAPDVEEVPLEEVLERIIPEDRPLVPQATEEAIDNDRATLDFRMIAPDGSTHWIRVEGELVRDAIGRPAGAYGTSQDVTEHKRIEISLRQTQQDLLQAQMVGSIGNWRLNVNNELTWSDQNYAIFGISKGTPLTYETFLSLVHPNDRAYVDAQWKRCLAGEVYDVEHRIIVDGKVKWVREKASLEFNKDGGVLGAFGITQDITKRVLRERALRFTQFAVDHASDEAYWIDKDAAFVYVNDAACKALGYRREELLRMKVADVDPDFPMDVWPAHWEKKRQDPTMRFEARHRTKDGRIYPVEITSNFLMFENIEYACSFARDITDRKVAEQTRDVLMQQLQERNEELQSIVFAAAHDLRSPLVNITGFTGELEKDLTRLTRILEGASLDAAAAKQVESLLKSDLAESLRFIKFGNKQMDMLLHGLMRLSRVGSVPLKSESLNMNDLFEAVVRGFRYQIKMQDVDISVQEDLPGCIGDYSLVAQVLINLLDNAIKYRHPDRSIIIRVAGQQRDDKIVYTITDNGIGIEPEQVEQVFNLFHRLVQKPDATGEGVGLTIVRRILDRLNGSVWITSTAGQGTTVYVQLPAV